MSFAARREARRRRIHLLARKIYFSETGQQPIRIGKLYQGQHAVAVGDKIVIKSCYKLEEPALRELELALRIEAKARNIEHEEIK